MDQEFHRHLEGQQILVGLLDRECQVLLVGQCHPVHLSHRDLQVIPKTRLTYVLQPHLFHFLFEPAVLENHVDPFHRGDHSHLYHQVLPVDLVYRVDQIHPKSLQRINNIFNNVKQLKIITIGPGKPRGPVTPGKPDGP